MKFKASTPLENHLRQSVCRAKLEMGALGPALESRWENLSVRLVVGGQLEQLGIEI